MATTNETAKTATQAMGADTSASPSNQDGKSAPNTKKKRVREFVEVSNDLAEVWDPQEAGAVLEGFYTSYKDLKVRNSKFRTYNIQNEETGEILSFSGAIADRIMARIKIGTYIRVTYEGRIHTSNGSAKDYTIAVEKGAHVLDENDVNGAAS